jgi:hypothetical protein
MNKGSNKIQSSPFRDYAAKLLLSGFSWRAVAQELKRDHFFDVDPKTVKSFDENFVKKLDEQTIAKLKEEIREEREKEEQILVDSRDIKGLSSKNLEKKDDFYQNTEEKALFEERPLPLREFMESDYHMNFKTLTERQYEPMEFLLGSDVEKIWDTGNYMAVLEYGKGSGKDTIAFLFILYLVYWLLCCRDPQSFFKLPEGEPLDILNVAYNAFQAQSVFFEKLRQKVFRWKWLHDHYKIINSGVTLNEIFLENKGEVNITQNGILFPKLIRAFSGHSMQEGMEGLNLIAAVMDEASAFKDSNQEHNADKLYRILRTSTVSRFGLRGKTFILSYPRYKGDFIERMYEKSLSQLHVYGDKASTWEVKPASCFSGEYFTFEGRQIPVEFKEDYDENPTDSKSKYECLPSDAEMPFLEYPEKIEACINRSRLPIVDFTDYIEDGMVKKVISGWRIGTQPIPYVVTVDLGKTACSAAVTISHKEGDKIVQDATTTWVPDPDKGVIVSFVNLANILEEIAKRIIVICFWFDHWNSEGEIQRLRQKGLIADAYSLHVSDYFHFKKMLYSGNIDLLDHANTIHELKQLQFEKGENIGTTGKKDIADTLVGAAKVFQMSVAAAAISDEGEIIGENLSSEGTFIPGTFV